MSVIAEPIAVPFPQEIKQAGRARRLRRSFVEYVRLTGWLLLIKIALKAVYWSGWAMMVVLLDRAPPLLLAMTPHPIVLASTAHRMPLATFFLIAIVRLMMPDPINYLVGKRSIDFFQDHKGPGWLNRVIERLAKARSRTILAAVFGLTVLPPPGIPFGPNVYMVAGAAKTRFIWVMAMSFAARVSWVVGFYLIGSFFNPLAALQRCF